MSVPCRYHNRINGRACFARKSLAQAPDDYAAVRYQPKCTGCGARKWAIDRWRIRHEMSRGCNCGGYWFPHREGSKYCYSHPDVERNQSERYGT